MNLSTCMICPRNCGIDRSLGEKGYCGETGRIRIARAALHFWEEPVICGERGSGAVFFTGCNLKCIFCQNAGIAAGKAGKEVSVKRLSEIFMELQNKGAVNINLVTASHYILQVAEAILLARKAGLSVPVVYNTSSYEKPETLKVLEGLVDIYLPDFKYEDEKLAANYSKAADYPAVAKEAIEEMYRQVGAAEFDADTGMMKKGVIVRHLVMPGAVKNAKAIIDYLYGAYGDDIYFSLMNQYTPMKEFVDFPELNRRVTKREYDRVIQYALDKGIKNAFIQEGETAKISFIPPFDCEGV